MNATPIVGIGAGGHAKVVIDILQLSGEFEIVGLLDANASLFGTSIQGAPVLGDDGLLPELLKRGVKHAFIAVASVRRSPARRRLFELAQSSGFQVISAVHPSAVVSPSASVGEGAVIGVGAIVNAGARLGKNVIVNTGAIVEHDCVVGDHAHIATAAALAGGVTVGEETHVGLGARIREYCRIGSRVTVGAGAVVVTDIGDDVVVTGIPAKVVQR